LRGRTVEAGGEFAGWTSRGALAVGADSVPENEIDGIAGSRKRDQSKEGNG